MHIPDGYLSPQTAVPFLVAYGSGVGHSGKKGQGKTKKERCSGFVDWSSILLLLL